MKKKLFNSALTLLLVMVFILSGSLWLAAPKIKADESALWTPGGLNVNLAGAAAVEEQFKFELSCSDGRKLQAANDASGNITFTGLTFTAEDAGETVVRVKQTEGSDHGIRYDNTVLTYKLKISTEGSDVTVTKTEGPDSYTFSNEVIKECLWQPQAIVRFKNANLPIKPDRYSVRLDKFTDLENSEYYTVASSSVETDGTVNFDPLTYSLNDVGTTEYYRMSFEEHTLESHISLEDSTAYVFKVEPQLNGDKVEVSATMYEEASNVPLAETVPLFELNYSSEGRAEIQVPVYVYNTTMPGDEFEFKLYEGEDTDGTLLAEGSAFQSDQYSGFVYFKKDDGIFRLQFTPEDIMDGSGQPKVHKYCVVQTPGSDPDFIYDTEKVIVHITLEDDSDGHILPTITFPGKSSFVNEFKTTDPCICPEITLNLDDGDYHLPNGKSRFEFKLEMINGDFVRKAYPNQYGKAFLEPLYFYPSDDGETYQFKVTQTDRGFGGYILDTAEYLITAKIKEEGGKAVIESLSYTRDGVPYTALPGTGMVFENTMEKGGVWQPEFFVKLDGRELHEGEFAYILECRQDGKLINRQTVVNQADGRIPFAPVTLRTDMMEHGLDVLVIPLKNDELQDIAYDSGGAIATHLDVLLNEKGLTAVRSNERDTFNNSYLRKTTGKWLPDVRVALLGRKLKNEEFKFEISELGVKAVNNLHGLIAFPSIEYGAEDVGKTFTYTFKQIAPVNEKRPIDWDQREIKATVKITDPGTGNLQAEASYSAQPIFVNKIVQEGKWQPMAVTELLGAPLGRYMFKAELKENGSLLQAVYNDDAGALNFEPITYTKADIGKTFHYTLSEVDEGLGGCIYDTAVRNISVSVTEKDGKLLVTPSPSEPVIFKNGFEAKEMWWPEVGVSLAGRSLTADEFNFKLEGNDGTELTASNTGTGAVHFDGISYSQDDIGKTFVYTITQIIPDTPEEGMTYDSMQIKVFVEIEYYAGALYANVSYPQDRIFNNVLSQPGHWIPQAVKKLNGGALLNDEFSFVLRGEAEDGEIELLAGNKEDGTISFDPLQFTLPDKTYEFSMYERIPDTQDPYTNYDLTVYKIKVTTSTDENGELVITPDYGFAPNSGRTLPTFVNYKRGKLYWAPKIDKVLENAALTDEQFHFELRQGSELISYSHNKADGAVYFTPLFFTEHSIGRTYHYTIAEENTGAKNFQYDTVRIEVTLRITGVLNGKLLYEESYRLNKREFNNQFIRSDKWYPAGEIAVNGGAVSEGAFRLELMLDGMKVAEMPNASGALVEFDPIRFYESDIGESYTYVMRQIPGKDPKMIYDKTKYTFVVTVKESDSGEVYLEIKQNPSGKVLFTNVVVKPEDEKGTSETETGADGVAKTGEQPAATYAAACLGSASLLLLIALKKRREQEEA